MSSLWTPGGEHPIEPNDPSSGASARRARPSPRSSPPTPEGPPPEPDEEQEDEAPDMDQLRQELARTPVETVIANHCYGLFELAALHLSQQPPSLPEARLAVDALGCLLEGLTGRLGEHETTLQEGLAQLRLAWVQIQAANSPGSAARADGEANNAPPPGSD